MPITDRATIADGAVFYGRHKGDIHTLHVITDHKSEGEPLRFKVDKDKTLYKSINAATMSFGCNSNGFLFWDSEKPGDKPPREPKSDGDSTTPRQRRSNPAKDRLVEEMAVERVRPSGLDDFECVACGATFEKMEDVLAHLDSEHPVNGATEPTPDPELEPTPTPEPEPVAV